MNGAEWLARSPVQALTGRKRTAHQHRNACREIPHAPPFAPVTKVAAQVDEAALPVPPRPVQSDRNGLMRGTGATGAPPAALRDRTIPPHRPAPGADAKAALAAALRSAGRVVTIAGDAAALSGCGPGLLALAEAPPPRRESASLDRLVAGGRAGLLVAPGCSDWPAGPATLPEARDRRPVALTRALRSIGTMAGREGRQ